MMHFIRGTKKLAQIALYGLAFIYTAKLIDTLFHGVFKTTAAGAMVVSLNILAGLVQLLFFVALYQQYVPKDKPVLKTAAGLAIIGSGIGLLPKLLAMARLFQQPSLFFFIRHGSDISTFCPWIAAALLCIFCIVYFIHYEFKFDALLKKGFVAGAAGWFIMATAQSVVIINYLRTEQLLWLANMFKAGPIVFVIISTISFFCIGFFFLSFARR